MICSNCGIFTDDSLQACIGCDKPNPLNPKKIERMKKLGKALIELSKDNMYKEDIKKLLIEDEVIK